jgi:hypothetical protein
MKEVEVKENGYWKPIESSVYTGLHMELGALLGLEKTVYPSSQAGCSRSLNHVQIQLKGSPTICSLLRIAHLL